jgi:hypothetical protein
MTSLLRAYQCRLLLPVHPAPLILRKTANGWDRRDAHGKWDSLAEYHSALKALGDEHAAATADKASCLAPFWTIDWALLAPRRCPFPMQVQVQELTHTYRGPCTCTGL